MPSTSLITFDRTNAVYYGGELLQGTIVLNTESSKTVRGVHITINGYAKVRWTETRSRTVNGKTRTYTVTYSAHNQYLNSRTYMIGQEGGNSFELAPGTYNHTFACALPHEIPSSFEGQYGHIRYEVQVTVDRPFRFDNEFSRAFTVIHPVDLNLNPNLRLPKVGTDEKVFCCCSCGGGGGVHTHFNIPFGGYAPGQKIQYVLTVKNDSNNDLEGIKVKLEKRATFESYTPSRKHRYSEFELAAKTGGEVLRLSSKQFKDFLLIPSVPPTCSMPQCCISVDYWLTAKVRTGCCHNDISITFPVIIGTVPLVESATNPANVIINQPTAPIARGENGSPPGYDSVVPPSFEDALALSDQFKDEDKNEKHQSEPFVPKYPMYNNFAGPSAPPNDNDNGGPSTSQRTYGWDS